MKRANTSATLIAVTLTFVLFQFQNCAAPKNNAVALSGSSDSLDPEVRLIDDWNSKSVQFYENEMNVPEVASVIALDGLCSRENREYGIQWQLTEPNSGSLFSGQANCELGGFRVSLNADDHLACDHSYDLVATAANGETAVMKLNRQCASN